jgi:hypothetical protein
MTEQEILTKLVEAERELQDARNSLADARRRWTAAETDVISAKIHRDRVKEELRVHLVTTPKYEPDYRDLDLERFRTDHPELMEWIRERDEKKEE